MRRPDAPGSSRWPKTTVGKATAAPLVDAFAHVVREVTAERRNLHPRQLVSSHAA